MLVRNLIVLTLFLSAYSSLLASAGAGLIVQESMFTVNQTIDRLEASLIKNGMKIFAKIDHSKNSGDKLPPTTLLIFGNPKIGTQLMTGKRSIGIDLPMKALAYEENGKVWLMYNDPDFLARRHGITDRGEVLKKVSAALKKFIESAGQKSGS